MMHNLNILSLIMKMHPNVMENYYTESFKSKNGEIENTLSYGTAKTMVVSELCRLLHNENMVPITVDVTGDGARLLRLAALISFCVDVNFVHPTKKKKLLHQIMFWPKP